MKKLYVGNLPFQATEEDVGNWFTRSRSDSCECYAGARPLFRAAARFRLRRSE